METIKVRLFFLNENQHMTNSQDFYFSFLPQKYLSNAKVHKETKKRREKPEEEKTSKSSRFRLKVTHSTNTHIR